MTRGFYEQIGVRPDADLDEIKAAYGRAVAHVLRRREATVAQGGGTSALDLARAQLDEAWKVLSDAPRRRRYDAMLAVAGEGLKDAVLDDLWSQVAGAMIHPSVAAAARLVDVATTLGLGPLPEPPRPTGRSPLVESVDDDRVAVASRAPAAAGAASIGAFGKPRPVARAPAAPPALTTASSAARLAAAEPLTAPGTTPGDMSRDAGPPSGPVAIEAVVSAVPASGHDVEQLIDRLGYGGDLLRTLREHQGIGLQQLSETTRISARYLDAVEREDFDALPPAAPFVRGYVREVARVLGLDVERVVAGYMRRFDDAG